jgi:diphthine synthase
MLWLIGLGIEGIDGMSMKGRAILETCKLIYIERFTGYLSESELRELRLHCKHDDNNVVNVVGRLFVEDGRDILEQASNNEVAIIVYGDPLIATTYIELFLRATKRSIKVEVIHSASGITSLIGESGLQIYKFGRTSTIMSEPQSAISVYNTLFDNLLLGNHTLILTEYNETKDNISPFFLDPNDAMKMLLDVEKDQRSRAFTEETYVIVASRIGRADKKIISGQTRSLLETNYGTGPHSLIVPGRLHFVEQEAISNITSILDEPTENSSRVSRISTRMVEKYVPSVKKTINELRKRLRTDSTQYKGINAVLDNAEYYVQDAEKFLNQGKNDLAVLSVGYAEGLIDAISFQRGLDPR